MKHIVMLNEVKHLDATALRCLEMLPSGQHDNGFAGIALRSIEEAELQSA